MSIRKMKCKAKIKILLLLMITINLTLTGTNLKNGYCYGQTKKETKEKFSKQAKEAYRILAKAKGIQSSYLTMLILPSPYVAAFRCILKDPDRDKIFKKLFQEKNIVSKLYALGGLYFTDHSQFQILVQDFKTFGYTLETVTTEEGCVTDRFTVAEFVAFLEDGHWPEIWRGDISF